MPVRAGRPLSHRVVIAPVSVSRKAWDFAGGAAVPTSDALSEVCAPVPCRWQHTQFLVRRVVEFHAVDCCGVVDGAPHGAVRPLDDIFDVVVRGLAFAKRLDRDAECEVAVDP